MVDQRRRMKVVNIDLKNFYRSNNLAQGKSKWRNTIYITDSVLLEQGFDYDCQAFDPFASPQNFQLMTCVFMLIMFSQLVATIENE